MSIGRGINEFGMTKSFFDGQDGQLHLHQGLLLRQARHVARLSGCEAGKNYKKPPAKDFDPLYITVPLGFSVPMAEMECPTGLVCVDHPARST